MTAITQATQPALARTKQTAEHFQISGMTLHRWRQRDGFPQPLKCGAIVLYDIAAINQWLAAQGEG